MKKLSLLLLTIVSFGTFRSTPAMVAVERQITPTAKENIPGQESVAPGSYPKPRPLPALPSRSVDKTKINAQLLEATKKGDAIAVTTLLAAGANPNTFEVDPNLGVKRKDQHTNDLKTPLMYAAKEGNVAIATSLLKNGADVNARSTVQGWTPLHFAVDQEDTEMVEFLLNNKANPNKISAFFEYTPLMWAARKGSTPIIKLLIDNGALVGYPTNDLITALMIACEWAPIEAIQILIEHSDPTAFKAKSHDGMTSLHYASKFSMKHNSEDAVKLLLDKGAAVNVQDRWGKTPLIYAAKDGQFLVVQMLLSKGAEIDATDIDGKTALMHTIEAVPYGTPADHVEIATYLLEHGANVNAANKRGKTVLMYAVQASAYDTPEFPVTMTQLALKYNAAIDARDDSGKTARDYARTPELKELLDNASKPTK